MVSTLIGGGEGRLAVSPDYVVTAAVPEAEQPRPPRCAARPGAGVSAHRPPCNTEIEQVRIRIGVVQHFWTYQILLVWFCRAWFGLVAFGLVW